jgi:anti-repressor protein
MNVIPFNYHDKEIRTIQDESGNPWFVAKDIAATLGYSDTDQAIRNHCKLSKLFKPVDLTGLECGPRGMMLIPEPDVYRLIAKSTLPAAEQFEAWIFEEVLPSIRKSGGYIAAKPDDTNEEIMARAILLAKETMDRQKSRIETLELENQLMKPKAFLGEAVMASDTSISVGALAKIMKQNGYETGQNRLFAQLRDEEYLIKREGVDFNMPTQKAMALGLFEIKERVFVNGENQFIKKTTMVTGKGQQYFISKYLSSEAA